MQRLSFYAMLGLFTIILLVTSVTPAVSNINQDDHTIIIGAGISIEYNVTSIHLEKNTEYTIIFEIFELGNFHNLVIDIDNDVSEFNINDDDDLVIGIANDSTTLGGETVWSDIWITPDMNINRTYFCSIPGHFNAGMKGGFIVDKNHTATGSNTTSTTIPVSSNILNTTSTTIPVSSNILNTTSTTIPNKFTNTAPGFNSWLSISSIFFITLIIILRKRK